MCAVNPAYLCNVELLLIESLIVKNYKYAKMRNAEFRHHVKRARSPILPLGNIFLGWLFMTKKRKKEKKR